MTLTDSIIVLLSIFLLIKGYSRGLLASLLGPMALIIATLISFVYYLFTKNILVSLFIGLIGPFVVGGIFKFLLNSWSKTTNPRGYIFLLSRLAGALVTWGWGLIMLIITVLLLAIIPPVNKPLEYLYKDIHLSVLYQLIKPLDFYAINKDDFSADVESLSEDKRIQDIINDPQIQQNIKDKNYSSILSNKKIAALMQDPQLMKKIINIYRQMMKEQLSSRK